MDISIPTGLLQPVTTRAVLSVNGRKFNSWKSISINRSIAQIAGEFSFSTGNRFAGNNEKWNIEEGDECTIDVADERVLTGYIDGINDGYTSNSHDITFSGRDKTADLVDCPYDVFTLESEFLNQTFLQIITKLADSVGVGVVLDTLLIGDTDLSKLIPEYRIQTGEMLYESISKLCQKHGVLVITTGDGDILLTRAGLSMANDLLESGVNIKANRVIRSLKDRYSVYYGEGQTTTTAFSSDPIAEGKFEDEYVKSKRFRPYIIMLGDLATNDTCQKAAAWEGRIRMGGSGKVETTVRKWTQTNGKIWPLNGLVNMIDKKLGLGKKDKLLIAGIALNLDSSGGELTTMSLVHPDTFVLKERAPIKSTDGLNAFGRSMK